MDRSLRPITLQIALFAAFALMCILFFVRLQLFPSLSDAKNYVNVAAAFRDRGVFADFPDFLTYLYPFVIYLISFISGIALAPAATAAVQCAAYALLCWLLNGEISRYSPQLGKAVLIGLVMNFLVIILLVDTLTEGMTIIIALGLTWIALRSSRAHGRGLVWWLSLGAGLAAAAIMIRPANISLAAAWHIAAVFRCFWLKADRRTGIILAYVCLGCLFSAFIFAPQVIYNIRTYDKATVFPTRNLGSLQIGYGIVAMKYATAVTPDGAHPVVYHNPFSEIRDFKDAPGSEWYVNNPGAGLKTLLVHIFNAFSWDYPFVYIYDLVPWYRHLLPFVVWIFIIPGALFGCSATIHFVRAGLLWSTLGAPAVFVGGLFTAAVALNSIVAVENRYNILPTMILAVFAVYGYTSLLKGRKSKFIAYASCFGVLAALATGGTLYAKRSADFIVKAREAAP